MNGPEILHLIRHDLQSAVARQGKPPTPRPTDASPWLAMSALQKVIRRGREDVALSAAATLLRDAPDRLWRRIGCIAYEDIGVVRAKRITDACAEQKIVWEIMVFLHSNGVSTARAVPRTALGSRHPQSLDYLVSAFSAIALHATNGSTSWWRT